MPRFRYTAIDAQGQTVHGEVEAADSERAREQLTGRGLRPGELQPIGTAPPARLSAPEAEQFVITLAEISDSQLPLTPGLRAAASETANRRLADALHRLADDIERGVGLEAVLEQHSEHLPLHVRGLISAAARTNRLSTALDELVEHHRTTRESLSQITGALAYPLIVMAATLVLVTVLPLAVVPHFQQIFAEWDIKIPPATQVLIALSDIARWLIGPEGLWLLIAAGGLLVGLCIAVRLWLGTGWRYWLMASLPLLGPMWQWSGVAAFARLLATLLDYGIPLPLALQLVSDGLVDPAARAAATALGAAAEQGRPLSQLLGTVRYLPPSMVAFVRWGESTGRLPDALRTVNDLFLIRLRTRALVVYSIGPAVVFLLAGLLVGFFVLALFRPLVGLIQGLS